MPLSPHRPLFFSRRSLQIYLVHAITRQILWEAPYSRTVCKQNCGTLLQCNKNQLKSVTGLIGHCHLKGHLYKLGLVDDPTSSRCRNSNETASRVLSLAGFRYRHFDAHLMSPSDYHNVHNQQTNAIRRVVNGINDGDAQQTISHCGAGAVGRSPTSIHVL
jgi:hypothetical protein